MAGQAAKRAMLTVSSAGRGRSRFRLLAVFLFAGTLQAAPAQAGGWYGGGGWHGGAWYGGGWHGGWRTGCCWGGWGWWGPSVSLSFAAPLYYPYAYPYPYPYAYPYPYPYPGYVPPVVQQVPPGPAPQQSWYYCANPRGYYPYVQSCSSGWQQVPVAPPTTH
jgi:hypothetical protein